MDSEAEQQWPIPDGLSAAGRFAADVLWGFLVEKQLTFHADGCTLYSPAQWSDRGETGATSSLLVISHGGRDQAGAFNINTWQPALREQLRGRLREHGLVMQACTSWFTAVCSI